jgi:cyclophilin family peptidyl-prolyl cis-trans isomerase
MTTDRTRIVAWLSLIVIAVTACSKSPEVEDVAPAPWGGADPIFVIDEFIAARAIDKTNAGWKTQVPRPPRLRFDPTKTYYWFLTTSEGLVKIELYPDTAPYHVSNIIYLTRLGFYDDLTFHRIIPQFMAQGGDPLGNGTGDAGYRFAGEFDEDVTHDGAGIVSTANSGPRTDGSQFFILFKEQPGLDGKHTIFGRVVEGKGTMNMIELQGSKEGKPRKQIDIRRAEIWVE